MLNQLEQRPVATDIDDDDTIHVACRYDYDWSLCGQDVSDASWTEETSESEDCATCEDFDEADFCAHCAMNAGAA